MYAMTPPLARLALGTALALSTACATTGIKVTPPPVPVPSTWARPAEGTSTATQDLARWWERLNDPVLSRLIDRTLQASPDVRTAQSRLRQARGQRNLAQANRKPTAAASASLSGSKRSDVGASATFSPAFDASWEPDVFGGLRSAVQAAEADLAATESDLHKTQVSLAAEVAVNYVGMRGDQARLKIAEANLATQAETLQLTEWRAQAGLVGSVDVEQARASLAQTQAAVPNVRLTLEQAQHRLAVLAGLPPSALVEELDAVAAVPTPPDGIAIGIPAESLRQRPDVRAAEQRLVAETARLAQSRAARFPSFSLRGSLGTDVVSAALTGGTSVAASLVASVSQTIFDGGRIRQQIAIQGAVQEQAAISYESTVLTAFEEVENALASLEQNRLRLASLATAAEASRNAALLARHQYAAGLSDFQTVLDTQRTLLAAEDSLATTQVSRATALVQLYKALGGGWSPAGADAATAGDSHTGRQS
jgi:outer membrane protein, multidrug efflux system